MSYSARLKHALASEYNRCCSWGLRVQETEDGTGVRLRAEWYMLLLNLACLLSRGDFVSFTLGMFRADAQGSGRSSSWAGPGDAAGSCLPFFTYMTDSAS